MKTAEEIAKEYLGNCEAMRLPLARSGRHIITEPAILAQGYLDLLKEIEEARKNFIDTERELSYANEKLDILRSEVEELQEKLCLRKE